jgi:hypothetical protein
MAPLRLIAIASNIAFIGYGYLGQLAPILALHAGLLPLNVWRLCQSQSLTGRRHGASLSTRFLRVRSMSRCRAGGRASPDKPRRLRASGRPGGGTPQADGAPRGLR